MADQIETSDLTDRLVGIRPVYLNRFIQRHQYGVRASAQEGKVREQRRKFNREDVFGIALVWLLFESGLRSEPIRWILRAIGKSRTADTNRAAQVLQRSGAEYLAYIRHSRRPGKQESKVDQQILICTRSQLGELCLNNAEASITTIPVGSKFNDIQKRLELLF